MTRAARILAAVAFGATAALGASVTVPAPAAATSGCDGVWVVVDPSVLGATATVRCAPGDPSSGLAALTGAGHQYAFVPTLPGMVCSIDAQPASCNGPPATDAYWSYWHAEAGGSWRYSSQGASSRDPQPGSVEGWAFGAGKPPSAAPPDPPPDRDPDPPEPKPDPQVSGPTPGTDADTGPDGGSGTGATTGSTTGGASGGRAGSSPPGEPGPAASEAPPTGGDAVEPAGDPGEEPDGSRTRALSTGDPRLPRLIEEAPPARDQPPVTAMTRSSSDPARSREDPETASDGPGPARAVVGVLLIGTVAGGALRARRAAGLRRAGAEG